MKIMKRRLRTVFLVGLAVALLTLTACNGSWDAGGREVFSPGTGTGNFACLQWVRSHPGGPVNQCFVSGDIGGLWRGTVMISPGSAPSLDRSRPQGWMHWEPAHRGWHMSLVRQIASSETTGRVYALGAHSIRPQFEGQGNVSRSVKRMVEDASGIRWEDMPVEGATRISHLAVGHDLAAGNLEEANDFLVGIGPGDYPGQRIWELAGERLTEILTKSPKYHPLQLLLYAGEEWHKTTLYDPYNDPVLGQEKVEGTFSLNGARGFEHRLGIGSFWLDAEAQRVYFTASIETCKNQVRLAKCSGIFEVSLDMEARTFGTPSVLLLSRTALFEPIGSSRVNPRIDIDLIESAYPDLFTGFRSPVNYHPLVVTGRRVGSELQLISTVGPMVTRGAGGSLATVMDNGRVAVSTFVHSSPVWQDEFAFTADGTMWKGQYFYVEAAGEDVLAGVYSPRNTSIAEWAGLWRRTEEEDGPTWKRITRMVSYSKKTKTDLSRFQQILSQETLSLPLGPDGELQLEADERWAIAVGSEVTESYDGFHDTAGNPHVFFELRAGLGEGANWKDIPGVGDVRIYNFSVKRDAEGSGGSSDGSNSGMIWRYRTLECASAWQALHDKLSEPDLEVPLSEVRVRLKVYIKTEVAKGKGCLQVHWSRNDDPLEGPDFPEQFTFDEEIDYAQGCFDTTLFPTGGLRCDINLDLADSSELLAPNMHREDHWRSSHTNDIRVERMSIAKDAGGLKILLGANSARGLFLSTDGGENFHPLSAQIVADSDKRRFRATGIESMEVQGYHRFEYQGKDRLVVLTNDGGPFLSVDGGRNWRWLADDMQYFTPSGKPASDVFAVADRRMAGGKTELYASVIHILPETDACHVLKSVDGGKSWMAGQNGNLPEDGETWSMTTVRGDSHEDVIYAAVGTGPLATRGIYYLPPGSEQWVQAPEFLDGIDQPLVNPFFDKVVSRDGADVLFVSVTLPGIKYSHSVPLAEGIDPEVQAQTGLYMIRLDPETGFPVEGNFRQIAGIRAYGGDPGQNPAPQAFRHISDVDFLPLPGKGTYRVAVTTRMVKTASVLFDGGVWVRDDIPMTPAGEASTTAASGFTLLQWHPMAGAVTVGPRGSVYAALGHYGRVTLSLAAPGDHASLEEDLSSLTPETPFHEKYMKVTGEPSLPRFAPGIHVWDSLGAEWQPRGRKLDMEDVSFNSLFLRSFSMNGGPAYLYIGTSGAGGYRIPLAKLY